MLHITQVLLVPTNVEEERNALHYKHQPYEEKIFLLGEAAFPNTTC